VVIEDTYEIWRWRDFKESPFRKKIKDFKTVLDLAIRFCRGMGYAP